MRIMLTDRSETSAQLAEGLRHDGHEILDACLPAPGTQQGCTGLLDHSCPLDEGVDLAITALERVQDVASAGTVCAHRVGVPVVNLGRHDAAHPDLSPALARIAAHGDEVVISSIKAAMERALDNLGIRDGQVMIERTATVERIVAIVPDSLDHTARARLAVRLLDAATTTGRHGIRRDVVVRTQS